MNNNYLIEVDAFNENFKEFADKKIILYGIGRKTATLVPELTNYKIVGLMDRDAENIGKIMFGLPIVSLKEAEKIADMIIINSPSNYWRIIFERINKSAIPVYYTDGALARECEEKNLYADYQYWNNNSEELINKMGKYDIVSFDLFDTLIMRKTYLPETVWQIIEKNISLKWKRKIDFVQYRKIAINHTKIDNPSIYDIYNSLRKLADLSMEEMHELLQMELETEEILLIPRSEMIMILKKAQELDKLVYIVSDMHLPKEFLIKIIKKFGVCITEAMLWVSNDKKANKNNGEIWNLYTKQVVKNKKALHIGDHKKDDIVTPQKYGIDTYFVMNGLDMINNSALCNLSSNICSKYASAISGLVIANIFNNPFCLSENKGNIVWKDNHSLGYSLFGPVILTYLEWIEKLCHARGENEIIFMARDGYFLYEDYMYMNILKGEVGLNCKYLEISRRAVMIPSIVDNADLEDAIAFPYNGKFSDFMQDRFDIKVDMRTATDNGEFISTVNDFRKVYDLCKCYNEEILNEVKLERDSYLNYFKLQEISDSAVYVDLFFYGNTQFYLSKLLNKTLMGFYMACDLTDNNRCAINNGMFSCFQLPNDKSAYKCNILKKCLILESFLTAPTGMLLKTKNGEEMIRSKKGRNQEFFNERFKINEGVKDFIKDYLTIYGDNIKLDTAFIDFMYGEMVNDNFALSDSLKNQFFFDNALIQRREMKIYE